MGRALGVVDESMTMPPSPQKRNSEAVTLSRNLAHLPGWHLEQKILFSGSSY